MHSSSSMPIILVVRQAILFGMTRRNKLQYPVHFKDWVKAIVFRRSKCQSSFCSVLPWSITILCQDCHENCTFSHEFLMQWYFLPSLFIPRFPCYCNRNADKWIMMCEINTPSNCVAWYLMDDNSICVGYWTIILRLIVLPSPFSLVHSSINEIGLCQSLTLLIISSCPEKQDCSWA